MPQRIYLDTNAFRYFGMAFEKTQLPDDLRRKMLISPLSAFEIFGQLANDYEGATVLRQIQAIRNWTNPQNVELLPWPDEMLAYYWFQKQPADNGFTRKMQHSFNICLTTDSLATIREAAAQHRTMMDDFKLGKAQDFKNMLDAAKAQKQKTFDMTEPWFLGVANRINADPNSKSRTEIISVLSAYYEFELSKLQTALALPEYNPLSKTNQNDIIDSEQLVYLGDRSLCLLTCDRGFKSKVRNSEQRTRIITVPAVDLQEPQKAEATLREVLTAS